MTAKKTPALLGADTGGICVRQHRHFIKNAQVHHQHGAMIRIGAEHTLDTAVATFAEKKVFSRPEFFGTTGNCRSFNGLMGLGASIPQGRRHGCIRVFKPSPTMQSEQLHSGFSVHTGTKMKSTTTGQTAPTQNTDHHQTDLFFQASNHLSQALYQLRHATGDQGIKTAAGRANAAARALNRLATAYSTKRKQVELVPVTDPRVARYYPETSGGLCGDPDGPWLLAIGRKCTDQQLEQFAQREGFSVAELIAFRDSLEVASE